MFSEDIMIKIKFGIFSLFLIIILNAIKKKKLEQLKSESNTDKLKFTRTLFRSLLTVPIIILIYWIILILCIEIIYFFINYLLYTPGCSDEEQSKKIIIEDEDKIPSLPDILKKNLFKDMKLFFYIFTFNIFIIIFIFFFMIILKKPKNKDDNVIDNSFIVNLYNFYTFSFAFTILLCYIYLNLNFN